MAYGYSVPKDREFWEVMKNEGPAVAGPFYSLRAARERAEVLADSSGLPCQVYYHKSRTHTPRLVSTAYPKRGRR